MHYANDVHRTRYDEWAGSAISCSKPQLRSGAWADLSRSALRSGDWPGDTKMQPRSLAALFSKLDRDQELDWLGDRPGAQLALAKALGASLDDIRRASTNAKKERPGRCCGCVPCPPRARCRCSKSRCFRAFRRSAGASELFWHVLDCGPAAPDARWSGAGWRRAVSARFVRAQSWRDAASKLPPNGAVFVELEAAGRRAPCRCCQRVCGCAWRRRARRASRTPFASCATPEPEQYLRALVDWVRAATAQDGRFEPAAVLVWLSGEPLERGIIDGPGAVLGLCGLADELGGRALSEDLDKLLRRIAQARFRSVAVDPEAPHAAFFRKNGYGALVWVALVRRLLAEDAQPWDAPRPRERWLALVPEELQREADLDWLKMTLGTGAGALRSADLERAARKLPPGAFRVIRSFEQAGLLETTSADELKLGPRFVARALLSEAVAALTSASPIEWGTALLEGAARSEVEAHIIEKARATNGASLELLLETSDPESLVYVGALELGFVAAGLALLEGAELARELREGLFEDQLELMLELPGELPLPRVLRGTDAERAERHALWLLRRSACRKTCRITPESTRFCDRGGARKSTRVSASYSTASPKS